ncbi:DODA-type extradiol aromatic ring-opening family dioxygenase [Halarcobacter anaerophilus]|uniref:Dioxygenase n=1 Tax=Halarcobacter anaerophilus TaxID=877500 RepID=A0A4Q0Y1W4_9BACT|nr:class III extradiol ring-cleavage dioxygenase [Halarcobacter anaerophilus]QDF27737.1 dioxygenase, 4,5-DOPA dioxygenase family [Halarcobacter anaerophilus]RXJ64080.1 dioxygenase [Halarcobacter anaerophilus]
MLPSLYISHGSPYLMLMKNETTKFLEELSSKFEKPKFILVISAHWVTNNLKILYKQNPSLIYDFYNFPKELYELTYDAAGSLEMSDKIIELLNSHNIEIEKDMSRNGFDHGVWLPLRFMYPKAEIPVIQLSLPYTNVSDLYNIGNALQGLREDTLIIASGAMTHNLRDISWEEPNEIKRYAKDFRDWMVEKLENGKYRQLLNFSQEAPFVQHNHPTLEHLLPLFIALGSSKSKIGKSLHNVFMYGNQSMDTIIFKE